MLESLSLEEQVDVGWGTGFSDGLGSAGLGVGTGILEGFPTLNDPGFHGHLKAWRLRACPKDSLLCVLPQAAMGHPGIQAASHRRGFPEETPSAVRRG